MTHSIATYIALPGTTGEAMEHWHEVFGGELQILRYGDMPPMEGIRHEVRRQQGQPEQRAEISPLDLLRRRHLCDRRIPPLVQQPLVSKRPR